MPDVLYAPVLAAALTHLPRWAGRPAGIARTVEEASFPGAIARVDAVALVAEETDHHPDIDIRWRTVTVTLCTHSAGGVSAPDLRLAEAIDRRKDGRCVGR